MKICVLGDALKRGNLLLRKEETEKLEKLGHEVGNTIECIQEERYDKHINMIRESKGVVIDVDSDSINTVCEMGAIAEFNWFRDQIETILNNGNVENHLKAFLEKYPRKNVYLHKTDIRDTDIFLNDVALKLNPNGIQNFYDISKDITKDSCVYPQGFYINEDLKIITVTERCAIDNFDTLYKYCKYKNFEGEWVLDKNMLRTMPYSLSRFELWHLQEGSIVGTTLSWHRYLNFKNLINFAEILDNMKKRKTRFSLIAINGIPFRLERTKNYASLHYRDEAIFKVEFKYTEKEFNDKFMDYLYRCSPVYKSLLNVVVNIDGYQYEFKIDTY